jgi:hypothetical protein
MMPDTPPPAVACPRTGAVTVAIYADIGGGPLKLGSVEYHALPAAGGPSLPDRILMFPPGLLSVRTALAIMRRLLRGQTRGDVRAYHWELQP